MDDDEGNIPQTIFDICTYIYSCSYVHNTENSVHVIPHIRALVTFEVREKVGGSGYRVFLQ